MASVNISVAEYVDAIIWSFLKKLMIYSQKHQVKSSCGVQILTRDSEEVSHLSWAWVIHDRDVWEKIMVCPINLISRNEVAYDGRSIC